MKKLIISAMAFVFLFIGTQSAFAANWNSDPSDCQNTVAIANYTSNIGYGSCWTSTSMSAEPGDTINVRIYYHNTSSVTAKNVRFAVTKSSNTSTSHNFTGRIMSDNGDVSGNVNLTIAGGTSQSISFVDARWFPNQSRTLVSLPGGQSASDILSSGILIGDVAPGWSSQGTMVAVFKVSNNVAPATCNDPSATNNGQVGTCQYPPKVCTISDFEANPSEITLGDTSILSWHTNNCTSVKIYSSAGATSVSEDGTKPVSPSTTTKYTIQAYNSNGSAAPMYATVTVKSTPVQQMSGKLTANLKTCTIGVGSSTCMVPFTWTTAYPVATSSVTHDNITVGTGNNNSKSFSVSNGAQSYYLYNHSVLLDTETVSASCASGSAWNGSYCAKGEVIDNNSCSASLSASRTSINKGDTATLSWSTSGCTSATLYPDIGSVTPNISNSRTVTPTYDTTYTLTAFGKYGTSVKTVTITVNADQTNNLCTITKFDADDYSVSEGDKVVLTWKTENCNSVHISNVNPSSLSYSGTTDVFPTRSQNTYVINASGTYGSDSDSLTISINGNNNNNSCQITNFDVDDSSISEGDDVRFEWDTEDCDYVKLTGVSGSLDSNSSRRVSPTKTKTYVLTAYRYDDSSDTDSIKIYVDEDNNNDDNDDDDDYATPSVTTYMPSNITENSARISGYANGNGAKINSWLELPCYGKRYGEETNDTYTSLSASVYGLNPNATYNYCAVAQNRTTGQIVRGQILTFRTTNNYVSIPVYTNKNVVTTVATNITKTGAQLNGYITNSSYYNSSNTYFEYGSTVNLGSRTNSKGTVGDSSISDFVGGLSPNTVYFFRAVSDGADGVAQGSIEIFKTLANTVTTPVYVQGTTVIGTASPVMLEITNKYELIGAGDTIDYTVYYKNIGKSVLLNPLVQVVLPTNVTLINSSGGTYSVDTHTLSAPINNLNPGEEGFMYLQGRVDSIPLNNSQIATTAILVYTNTNGSQENAMAYVINVPRLGLVAGAESVLGGAALFGGLLSIGLIGWLIIILIILLLILIIRSTYGRGTNNTVITHSTPPTH